MNAIDLENWGTFCDLRADAAASASSATHPPTLRQADTYETVFTPVWASPCAQVIDCHEHAVELRIPGARATPLELQRT